MNDLIHKEITNSIIGGFFEVYNELGDGFLESVYEKSLSIILTENGLSVERQKDIPVYFRSHLVGDFKADLVVDGKVIVEIKAVRNMDPAHEAQIINYLKASNIKVGLLLNFGRKPEFKRFVYENNRNNLPQTDAGEGGEIRKMD